MIFLTAIFCAVMVASFFLFGEIRGRRRRGLRPGNLKQLWTYAQKRSTPQLRYSALIFAMTALFFFQIWEAFLRYIVQRESHLFFFIVGFLMVWTVLLLRLKRLGDKSETDLRLGSWTVVLMCLGLSTLLNSWGTLIVIPWVYFRSRFLPARLG